MQMLLSWLRQELKGEPGHQAPGRPAPLDGVAFVIPAEEPGPSNLMNQQLYFGQVTTDRSMITGSLLSQG